MLKLEFMNRMEKLGPKLKEGVVVLDKLSHQPDVMGCYQDGEFWKVYTTDEKGVSSVYIDTYYEEEAFDVLHRMVERKVKPTK